MTKTTLVFLHGLESGPHGSKYHALLELDPTLIAPDCSGIDDLQARLAVIETCLAKVEKMVIVGSSFGGLAALLFAQRPANRDRVVACLLCAPAFSLPETAEIERVSTRTIVLHGTDDDIVPFRASEDFCHPRGIELVAVKDDHRLSQSRQRMLEIAGKLLRDSDA